MANLGKKYSSRNTQQSGTAPLDAQPKGQSRVWTPDNPPESYSPPKPNQVQKTYSSPQPLHTNNADLRGSSNPVSDSPPIHVRQKDAEDSICGVFRSDRSSQDSDGRSTGDSSEKSDTDYRRTALRSVSEALRGFAGRFPVYWWLHLILIVLTVFGVVEVIINLDSIMVMIAYSVSRILSAVLIFGCIGIAVFLLIHRMRRR